MEKWKCSICGYVHEGPMTDDFVCPVCKQPASKFVKIEDTLTSFERILAGEGDALPEAAFTYVGTFDDVLEKAKTLK